MNVMVVDDEHDIKLLFKQKFRKEIRHKKVDFSFAFSADEALNFLKEENNHLILILADINMPGMNGLELLRIIKEEYPALKVFMITAYGDDRNYQTALKYGADDYLTKPIKFDKLKQKITELLLSKN